MFPQGWDVDSDCAEPVIEVFPEAFVPKHLLQIAVGGCNDLDVQGNLFRASKGSNALLLKNAQKFDLGFERDFGNLIQKDGPCISRSEKARGFVYGTGKSTFFVSEQFAFKEFFGNSAAIHGHKGIRGATAFVVDVLSDQVFSGTRFLLQSARFPPLWQPFASGDRLPEFAGFYLLQSCIRFQD